MKLTCTSCAGLGHEPDTQDYDAPIEPCRACGGSGLALAAGDRDGRLEVLPGFWVHLRRPRHRVAVPVLELADG
ncbi:MAG TPA: hypothetical protein VNR89_11870 [Roseomonas sp.]|nr:hypothetical protein [Roseomonas sp.]